MKPPNTLPISNLLDHEAFSIFLLPIQTYSQTDRYKALLYPIMTGIKEFFGISSLLHRL